MFESYHKLALEKHNDLRRLHSNTQALALDADLCVDASVYAQYLAEINTIKLLSGTSAGENIYSCRGDETDIAVENAITNWYSQFKNYSYETGRSSNATAIGNFTQMIWNGSTKMGIGLAKSGCQTFVVVRYLPAGNIIGEYRSNVKQKINRHDEVGKIILSPSWVDLDKHVQLGRIPC